MKSVTGRDPILVEGKERTVPFHFFFTRHKLVIHVTMLYERGVLGLWYGPIFQPNPSFYGIENEKSLASIEHFQNEGVLNTYVVVSDYCIYINKRSVLRRRVRECWCTIILQI